jgi:ABC-type uncharacterized transport system YnjBCD ATPase subunit
LQTRCRGDYRLLSRDVACGGNLGRERRKVYRVFFSRRRVNILHSDTYLVPFLMVFAIFLLNEKATTRNNEIQVHCIFVRRREPNKGVF